MFSIRDQGVWPPLILLLAGLVLLAFLPVVTTVIIIACVPLLDGLVLAISGPIRGCDTKITLTARPEGDLGATFAGATAIVTLKLEATGTMVGRRVTITPCLPPGVTLLGPASRRMVPRREVEIREDWRVRLDRVGLVVFPGVLIGDRGPLGIIHRLAFILFRAQLAVLPDYERSLNPVVSRYLRPGSSAGEKLRGKAVKGGGTEFAEIREYRPTDDLRRVDWKATARRARMLVREYEEPREFTLRLVVDGSTDLVGGEAYTRVAGLVSKLGYVATREAMGLTVTVIDEEVMLDRRLKGGRAAFKDLLAELVRLPRRALIETAGKHLRDEDLRGILEEEIGSAAGGWGLGARRWDPADLLNGYLGGATDDRKALLEALADLAPGRLADSDGRCQACGEVLFPDEGACVRCDELLTAGGLSLRTVTLATVLENLTRTSRGREMWVIVSAFAGGEDCREISDLLIHAATPHRRIHLVLPTIASLTDDRIEWPQSLGMYPTREGTHRDIEVLYRVERFREFMRAIKDAGIRTHALEEERELEEVIARVLLSEVLD
jgi:uncharacterized protein (DUF58 family)